MGLSALVLAGALALDVTVAEPPERLHPVAWFGRLAGTVDRDWRRPRAVGAVAAIFLPIGAGVAVAVAVLAAGAVDPLAGALAGALAVFVSTSLRRLIERVRAVVAASDADPARARRQVRALAGRDATALSPGQLRSAAVESLAENLGDGLIGPLFAYTVAVAAGTAAGTQPVLLVAVGCGAAAWVKGVNTLDSMLGYRTKPVGWASARLDDLVMWLPARASALLLALALGRPRALAAARDFRTAVSSPNAGWPMGTVAAALHVRLEKPGHYVLNPGCPLPDAAAARVAVRRVAAAGLAGYLAAGVVTWS